jgi:beta-glucanase (GH16 family)
VAHRRLLVLVPAVAVIALGAWLLTRGHASESQSTPASQAKSQTSYTKLLWSDEFNGPAGTAPAASKWIHDLGAYGAPDHELETYTDNLANASLDGHGNLAIVARRQTVTGPDGLARSYTSARLETQGLFSVKYGLIEARMKVPAGTGLWSAFWMLGDDITQVGWPASGEIDVIEALGQHPFTYRTTIHGPNGTSSGYSRGQNFTNSSSLASQFNTYGISWAANSITFLFNGTTWATVTSSDLAPGQTWVFNKPFHLVLDLAVGGDYAGPPSSSTRFPATLLVNWVRVYQ